LNFPDIGLNQSWSLSELPLLAEPPSVAPTSLNGKLIRSFETLLEPFGKKEFQHTAVFAFLYLYLSISKPSHANVSFLLRSAIPIGSGLGSSASISVCLATALLTIANRIPAPNSAHDNDDVNVLQTINSWAYLGEKCIHGNPSGVDNTVATFGGGVVYRKERQERRLSNGTFTPSKPAEKTIIK
jgi:mevalonate kinase